jgi:hypothetical protein
VEGGEDDVVDVLGGPAADLTTAVQQDLEEADDTGLVDLDSRIADRADGDWKGDAGCEPRRHADLVDPPKGWLFSGLGLAAVRQLAALSVAILS